MSEFVNLVALRDRLTAERLRIMRELGLASSPELTLPKVARETRKSKSKSKTSSSELRRRAEIRAEEEQAEAAAKGIIRKRLHPNMRLLQEAGLPVPARSRVGAYRVPLEAPGARRRTSKRRF